MRKIKLFFILALLAFPLVSYSFDPSLIARGERAAQFRGRSPEQYHSPYGTGAGYHPATTETERAAARGFQAGESTEGAAGVGGPVYTYPTYPYPTTTTTTPSSTQPNTQINITK